MKTHKVTINIDGQGDKLHEMVTLDQLIEQEKILNALAERLRLTQQDLRGTKSSIVHELELAGVTKSYDGESLNHGNYIQGIRILRDRALPSENTEKSR